MSSQNEPKVISDVSSSVPRRQFLKRSGAATAGAILAWHGSRVDVYAESSGEDTVVVAYEKSSDTTYVVYLAMSLYPDQLDASMELLRRAYTNADEGPTAHHVSGDEEDYEDYVSYEVTDGGIPSSVEPYYDYPLWKCTLPPYTILKTVKVYAP